MNAVSTGEDAFLSWRSPATDTRDLACNVYRTTGGETVKLNKEPLTGGTNFTGTTADLTKKNTYFIRSVQDGVEIGTGIASALPANSVAQAQILDTQGAWHMGRRF